MRIRFASTLAGRSGRRRAVRAVAAGTVILAVFGAGLVWLAGRHLVTTEQGLVVVPKRFVRLSGTCVDIRGWAWEDLVAQADVGRALIRAGYEDLLPRPPPEPTSLDKASAKMRLWRDEAAVAGTNMWQKVKGKLEGSGLKAD